MPRMPRSDDTRAEGPGRSPRAGRPRPPRLPQGPRSPQSPQLPRAYRRAGAWLAVFLGFWGAVAGVTLPNGLVLAAGLVVAALAVNRLGAEPRTAHRSKPAAPP
ncbi:MULTISPECIES: hypothetical protein [unclassified Streptomyces]|uniref:hypothetical protein n=1 Tax=unclassified Streptomyces TaxID=2593676 RepID=UPI002E151965|nr:hypothetical protein OG457_11670 [Streptomyces sp. NBC_01207]WTA17708.1 hypothetical protein OG365_06365 [Streptomyces sp. NBC_00853]